MGIKCSSQDVTYLVILVIDSGAEEGGVRVGKRFLRLFIFIICFSEYIFLAREFSASNMALINAVGQELMHLQILLLN